MDKMSNLNWIGICVLFIGIVSYTLMKQEKYNIVTAILCIVGVVIFILGFYIKK